MRKLIRLTENDLRKIFKQIITEKMGVPDNITETAQKIYDQIINEFRTFDADTHQQKYTADLYGDFHINDVDFDNVVFSINIEETDRIEGQRISGFQINFKSEVKGDKIIHNKRNSGEIEIEMTIVSDSTWTIGGIIDFINLYKTKSISSIAHELKHAYDNRKIPSESFKSFSKYATTQDVSFGGIKPMNDFYHYLYFIHKTEDLVRSSQFYSTMRTQNITKSQFKKFYNENEIIEILREARNFSLNSLIDNLHNYMNEIYGFFDYLESETDNPINRGYTDDANIEVFLNLVHQYTVNGRIGHYIELIKQTVNPFIEFIGTGNDEEGNKRQKMVDDYVKEAQKYKNYRDFFGNEAKLINFAAEKTLRKLSKLYDMAKEDKEYSIVDWDLHHQINNTTEKTLKEIKRLYQEGKIKLPTDKEKKKYIK